MKTKAPRRSRLLLILVMLIATIAIGGSIFYTRKDTVGTQPKETLDELPPCGANATQLALGSPYRGQTDTTAYFTTDGNNIYISARHFEHSGFLDPAVGTTGIWIGSATTTPSLNEQTGQVANTALTLTVQEGKHKKAQLSAGRYWLWTSTGGDILVESCGKLAS